MEPTGDDAVDVVRRAYDAVSHLYRGDDDATGPEYGEWLNGLTTALPAGAGVLDAGCGNGVPVARDLCAAGLRVTGVDVSSVQIARARSLVPEAEFVLGDVSTVEFPTGGFDAVVALYSIIHVPLERQPGLLRRFADWTRPGGHLLLVTGETAWTGTEDGWLGGDATMWWSHADAATYRDWLADAGWHATDERFVPEGDGGHHLFRCRRNS